MEDNLNFFANRRQPEFFSSNEWEMENDLNFFLQMERPQKINNAAKNNEKLKQLWWHRSGYKILFS